MEKKKPINSKSKGSGFEGQIAKKLTAALIPLTFMRTPGSGARLGGKNFELFGKMFGEEATKLFTGDVVPTNEKEAGVKFKFSIECKSYKTPDNFPGLVSGGANFFKWFEESKIDAAKINKEPMLICKWNHTSCFVGVRSEIIIPSVQPRLTISQNGVSIAVFDLQDLLSTPTFWYE